MPATRITLTPQGILECSKCGLLEPDTDSTSPAFDHLCDPGRADHRIQRARRRAGDC